MKLLIYKFGVLINVHLTLLTAKNYFILFFAVRTFFTSPFFCIPFYLSLHLNSHGAMVASHYVGENKTVLDTLHKAV